MMVDGDVQSSLPERGGARRNGIAQQIEDMILRDEVLPGERLNELALSHRLNVSHALLREAVRGLEELALLEIVPNCGVLVRQVSIKDALDLYDMRAALLRGAARLATRRALPEALAELSHLDVRMREAAAAERYTDYYASNLQFHSALMTAGGNAPMARAYDRAVKGLHLFRRRSLVHPIQFNLSLHEHEEFLASSPRMTPWRQVMWPSTTSCSAGIACSTHSTTVVHARAAD
jgi:DNA-binding GntR family transcriptional regulator